MKTMVSVAYFLFIAVAVGSLVRCKSFSSIPRHGKRRSTYVIVRGGYDATVSNPNLPIEFYTLAGGMCPYAARTLIVLHELGLDFETVEIAHQPKPDWYLNLNPRGKVPALRIPSDGNLVVYESAICDEYLCDLYEAKHGKPSALLPASPSLRARIRLLNDHYDSTVGPAQFTYLMNKDNEADEELCETLNKSLDHYESILRNSEGAYFFGSDLTLADVHVLPFFLRLVVSLRHFKGYELDRQRFSRVLQWFDRCSELTAVQAASKSNERIIEVYKMFVERDYKFGGLNQST